jgi:bifunctional non-homologous end joining protein LigD
MSLRDYHRKRDFSKTKEPQDSSVSNNSQRIFVIQRHDASHLHYDFRLEFDGTLKSWAVPKGPSTNPADKRLAMQVEDHPIDYATFEGTIPKGQYGGGEVKIWDHGYWKPKRSDKSVRADLKNGHLKFELMGEKLQGSWALVRMGKADQKNAWLLIKEKDNTNALTRGSKIFYPEAKITKLDVAEYYSKVAKRMLPHIADRPLMILRCPNGRDQDGFFQKNWNKTLPSSIKKMRVKNKTESNLLLSIDSEQGLIDLAQLGVLEIHTWGTHYKNIEHPDEFVFDIDPHENVEWYRIKECAYLLRDELAQYGLKSFLKTTGGKGLHVVAPVLPRMDWDLGKDFCKAICEDVARRSPSEFLTKMTKSLRKGKIFLDYLRNGRGSTAIAPYSPRARLDASIAMPLDWKELEKGVRSDTFHLTDVEDRLTPTFKDPWKDFFKTKQLPCLKKAA